MAKPDLTKWVTDDSAAKITDPGATKKLAGWQYLERAPFQYLNWLFNRISKWLLGLQGGYFDIVVGSSTQVTNLEATHTIADLNDTLVVAGSRVLFLDGTHTMAASLALTNAGLKIVCEPQAIIDQASTYNLTFSGAYVSAKLRLANTLASSVILSGANSYVETHGVDLSSLSLSNGAQGSAHSGVNGGVYIANVKLKTKLVTDFASNGAKADNFEGTADSAGNPTRMLFQQTTAPTGWTKDATHNDKALRIVSGSVTNGGSVAFSTVFGRTATDGHALTAAENGPHAHSVEVNATASSGSRIASGTGTDGSGSINTSTEGSGTPHSHNIDLQVQYVDVIIAVKD